MCSIGCNLVLGLRAISSQALAANDGLHLTLAFLLIKRHLVPHQLVLLLLVGLLVLGVLLEVVEGIVEEEGLDSVARGVRVPEVLLLGLLDVFPELLVVRHDLHLLLWKLDALDEKELL